MGGVSTIITAAGKLFYPSLLWNIPTRKKVIYLTFDDGPIPGITIWVLSLLKKFNAQATFFCIGDNVRKHPDIFKQILAEGHRIGNHTYNHLNGWNTSTDSYLENIILAEEIIHKDHISPPEKLGHHLRFSPKHQNPDFQQQKADSSSREIDPSFLPQRLFRPPYGKIKPSQVKRIKELGYKIVMWEVISGDYDHKRSPESCFNEVITNSKAGSIVVFHDSIKASANLKKILPAILKYYKKEGFEFRRL